MKILSLSLLFLGAGFAQCMEKKVITLQELEEKLLYFGTHCNEVTQNEVKAVAEHLQSNPDLKNTYANTIEQVVNNAWYIAANSSMRCGMQTTRAQLNAIEEKDSARDAALRSAINYCEVANNCSIVFESLYKVSENHEKKALIAADKERLREELKKQKKLMKQQAQELKKFEGAMPEYQ